MSHRGGSHTAPVYHNPAITALSSTLEQSSKLVTSHPELIEHILTLYDSHYSDAQFLTAFHTSFHPSVEFCDPGLHLHSRADQQAQFTYLRKWFTRFSPKQCNIAVGGQWVYLDLLMNWELMGGRVRLEVRHILRVHVEQGRVVFMEDVWSLNDRVAALLSIGNLYESIRWLISYPSTKYMRWQLGY